MKCHNCGMSLPDDSEFCQYCGEKVSAQMDQVESIVEEAFNNNSTTSHDENNSGIGGGRFLVDGPDGMPVWINADQLGKKQTVNEEEVHKLKESIKSRLISDYHSQDYTEKSAQDYEKNICPGCGQKLPDDSDFCPYCGKSLLSYDIREETAAIPIKTISRENYGFKDSIQGSESPASSQSISRQLSESKENNHTRYCKKCGGVIDSFDRTCSNCGKKYSRIKTAFLVLIPAFVLLVLLGLNVYQYLYNQNIIADIETLNQMLSEKNIAINLKDGELSDLQSIVSSLEDSISEKDTLIKTKDSKISVLQDQNSEYTHKNLLLEIENADLKEKAGFFDDICTVLSQGNLGYAANNFRASESVILVKKNQKDRKITLTANWTSGGTVSVSYSPPSFLSHASISFDSDSWQTSTLLTIIPKSAGIQTVEFSNNVDSKTFKIIIIVTE